MLETLEFVEVLGCSNRPVGERTSHSDVGTRVVIGLHPCARGRVYMGAGEVLKAPKV